MRAIDLHCHFIPPALVERIRGDGAAHHITVTERDGKQSVDFAGRDATQAFPGGMLDLEDRLRRMDAGGVDVQVVSSWMDFSAYVLDPEDGAWLARAQNELTVEAIAPYSDRFRALATVPLQAPELAVDELRYALEELGMSGVEIATSVVDAELDDRSLEPFWSAAEELGCLILIHPYASLGAERLTRYFLSNIVSNPAEETTAAAHLIYGGVLERHPGLKICLTHGGGFLPYQIGRQDRGYVALPGKTAGSLSRPPSEFLRSFLYDTVVHDPEALRFLVARVGAERVVLGSDYPFPMGDPDPVGMVTSAALGDEATAAILGGTAAELLGLEGEGDA